MINIHLSKNTDGDFDIVWEDGKIKMAEDGAATAVGITERVLLFRDECEASEVVDSISNPLAGVDYYGIIFDASKTKAEKELELKRVIRDTPGFVSILTWSWTQTDRTVAIDTTVKTQWGVIGLNQEFSPL